jgi:hypothetical protein
VIAFDPLVVLPIHQQIRAEWEPAAKACVITNVEICRNFYVNLLVTDVILLSIMLVGLLRLRQGDGGSFNLLRLLWKQASHCRFLLVVMLLSHTIPRFLGCHLARYCHCCRIPANGELVCVVIGHTAFHHYSPQLLLFLNVNGSLGFLSCFTLQHVDRISLGSLFKTLSTWYVLSCATDDGSFSCVS